MRVTRKKIILVSVISLLSAVVVILYLLADRFLIEHVEIENVNSLTNSSMASQSDLPAENSSEAYTADEWNYTSDAAKIAIEKVTTGTEKSTITYYVADVIVSSATNLCSAFADNQFGRNIIEYTSAIAKANNAVFAINGDYYGFRNDGVVIRNGVIYRNKPARTGLAFYTDGSVKIYDETQTDADQLLTDGVWNTLSFGPALVENSIVSNGLSKVEIDTNFGNHSIQGSNPRTGVGIIDKNHFVFVVVDGRSSGYSKGVSLTEFADIFKNMGCTDAYNLDGGGSSTMYFMGRVVNNPLGENKERGVSDILYIG